MASGEQIPLEVAIPEAGIRIPGPGREASTRWLSQSLAWAGSRLIDRLVQPVDGRPKTTNGEYYRRLPGSTIDDAYLMRRSGVIPADTERGYQRTFRDRVDMYFPAGLVFSGLKYVSLERIRKQSAATETDYSSPAELRSVTIALRNERNVADDDSIDFRAHFNGELEGGVFIFVDDSNNYQQLVIPNDQDVKPDAHTVADIEQRREDVIKHLVHGLNQAESLTEGDLKHLWELPEDVDLPKKSLDYTYATDPYLPK